jgi:hypothetical protein
MLSHSECSVSLTLAQALGVRECNLGYSIPSKIASIRQEGIQAILSCLMEIRFSDRSTTAVKS